MNLCDVNVLVNVFNQRSLHHALCQSGLASALRNGEKIALSSATAAGFLRVVASRHAVPIDTPSPDQALAFLEWLRAVPLVRAVDARGNLIPDAHLAALALDHGAQMVTMDKNFKRFPKLKVLHLKP